MNEFHYELTITAPSAGELTYALIELKDMGLIPNLLMEDTTILRAGNLYEISLSTDGQTPYGTVSCWSSEDHEKVLNELSLKHPDTLFALSGQDMDDPNDRIFKKAFQNGLFREAYQGKQDIDALLNNAAWRQYGTPVQQGREESIFSMYQSISTLRGNKDFQIAADMAYMKGNIVLDNALTDSELYTLAGKLDESIGTMSEQFLHEELLDSIRYMLEYGLNDNHSPSLPELDADNTRKLLLNADISVFTELLVIGAADNRDYYNVHENTYVHADREQVGAAIEAAKGSKQPLSEKIAAAQSVAAQSSHTPEKEAAPER